MQPLYEHNMLVGEGAATLSRLNNGRTVPLRQASTAFFFKELRGCVQRFISDPECLLGMAKERRIEKSEANVMVLEYNMQFRMTVVWARRTDMQARGLSVMHRCNTAAHVGSIAFHRLPGAGPEPRGAFPCAYMSRCRSSSTRRLLK